MTALTLKLTANPGAALGDVALEAVRASKILLTFVEVEFNGVTLLVSPQGNAEAIYDETVAAMAEGRMPLEPVFDGALVATAGLLLIAPGLITDVLGLILLVPQTRHLIFRWISGSFTFERRGPFGRSEPGREAHTDDSPAGSPFGQPGHRPKDPIIIEGEYKRIDERDPKQGGSADAGKM